MNDDYALNESIIETWQYSLVEIRLKAEDNSYGNDPDSMLHIVFRDPDGQERTGEGFWDGEDRWFVRFLPLTSGKYSWRSISNDKGLHDKRGELSVGPPKRGNIFTEHGPLKNAANERFFVHYDETPFFWLGESLWGVIQQSEEYELDEYFAVRRKQGFSAVQFNTLLNWESTTPYKREPFFKKNGLIDFDLYDISYFQYMDIVFQKCFENQMLAVPVAIWFNYAPGKKQDWYDPPYEWRVFTKKQAYRYGRYLGARYGAYPVAWLISADVSDNDPEAMEIFFACACGIRKASFNTPLISSHVAARSAYHERFANAEWTTFHFIQSGHRKDDIGFPAAYSRAVRRQCKKLPVVNGEMFFEALGYTRLNERIPLQVIRRAAWESFLCGANAGISYGAHGIWCWYSEGLDFRMACLWMKPTPWRDALKLPGPYIYASLRIFRERLPWYDLEEAPDLPIHEEGREPAIACRLQDGRYIVAYVPEKRHLRMTDVRLIGKPAVWFDPINARYEPAKIAQEQGGVGIQPPFWEHDCVLLVGPTS